MARMIIAEGNTYQVDSAFVPTSKEFEIVRFKDESGKNELTCFLDEKSRGQNIAKGDMVRINKITRASLGWAKKKEYDKSVGGYVEKWKQELTLNIEASKTASDLDDVDAWIDEVEGAALPWDDSMPV